MPGHVHDVCVRTHAFGQECGAAITLQFAFPQPVQFIRAFLPRRSARSLTRIASPCSPSDGIPVEAHISNEALASFLKGSHAIKTTSALCSVMNKHKTGFISAKSRPLLFFCSAAPGSPSRRRSGSASPARGRGTPLSKCRASSPRPGARTEAAVLRASAFSACRGGALPSSRFITCLHLG